MSANPEFFTFSYLKRYESYRKRYKDYGRNVPCRDPPFIEIQGRSVNKRHQACYKKKHPVSFNRHCNCFNCNCEDGGVRIRQTDLTLGRGKDVGKKKNGAEKRGGFEFLIKANTQKLHFIVPGIVYYGITESNPSLFSSSNLSNV